MVRLLVIVGQQTLLYLPLVFGAYLSFMVIKVPDFSIESALSFSAIIALKVHHWLYPDMPFFLKMGIELLCALGTGAIVGACTGFLKRFLMIEHAFISVMMIALLQGCSYYLLGTNYASYEKMASSSQSTDELFGTIFIIFVVIMLFYKVSRSAFGYCMMAYGYNRKFLKHYSINETFIYITSLMFSNGFAGIAGFLIARSHGYVDIHMGTGMSVFCFGCLMVGSMIYYSRLISMFVPLLGLIFYFLLQQCLLKGGITSVYFSMIQSFIIIIGLLFIKKVRGKIV